MLGEFKTTKGCLKWQEIQISYGSPKLTEISLIFGGKNYKEIQLEINYILSIHVVLNTEKLISP